ncbi:hypothetical protein BN946_scf184720.g3 [Trametes cinnabarina]|uniref:Uncharacterized protein n=1 Tax=Pycnoporus cinnabarinus TaxID=5643 RepID=A0A060T0A7_PYCCI|nr:hypothetical protein BN946_scf184720.g3 [Trametes cinnabarina]
MQRRFVQGGKTQPANEPQEEFITVNLPLRTLSPGRLSRDDYVDLSNSRALILDSTDSATLSAPNHTPLPAYIYYNNRSAHHAKPRFTAFPANTRGYFYYRLRFFNRSENHLPYGGSIRFRVCQDSDPRRFEQGQDLLTEYGTPWQMHLLAIGALPRFSLFKSVLQKDELISSDFWDENKRFLRNAFYLRLGPHSQVIYQCGEPFWMDLACPTYAVYVALPKWFYPLTTEKMFLASKRLVQESRERSEEPLSTTRWPFEKGVVICRLERDPQGESITTRVMRVVEPIRLSNSSTERFDTVDLPLLPRQRLTINGHLSRTILPGPRSRDLAVYDHLMPGKRSTSKAAKKERSKSPASHANRATKHKLANWPEDDLPQQ